MQTLQWGDRKARRKGAEGARTSATVCGARKDKKGQAGADRPRWSPLKRGPGETRGGTGPFFSRGERGTRIVIGPVLLAALRVGRVRSFRPDRLPVWLLGLVVPDGALVLAVAAVAGRLLDLLARHTHHLVPGLRPLADVHGERELTALAILAAGSRFGPANTGRSGSASKRWFS